MSSPLSLSPSAFPSPFYFSYTDSCYIVAQVNVKVTILLPQPSDCSDCRYVPLHVACIRFCLCTKLWWTLLFTGVWTSSCVLGFLESFLSLSLMRVSGFTAPSSNIELKRKWFCCVARGRSNSSACICDHLHGVYTSPWDMMLRRFVIVFCYSYVEMLLQKSRYALLWAY